ncbi:glycosyltransferase [Bacillus sp. ISL-18]|uniref:galactosyltransferase-related protein n=1 Tax=Bacillus sp. ISL-18 TaxID=2819118 RepID=UPI001BE8F2EB|nr:galactosyltransferase-related protein [Bacillus sp. ISL-18]MBT2655824.1 glycosyltransferase [Bacillus sp. ISL-18]
MLENVSIIIPFQTDYGPRADAFELVKGFYAHFMPETEICLGIINGEEINKAKAINLAAKKATGKVLVIADADVIYDPKLIVKSIELLNKGASWVVPFTAVYDVGKEGTRRLIKTGPDSITIRPNECTKSDWLYEGFAGKLFVIPRENFEAVGGFDERFIGWGGEDDAFSHAVRTLCGEIVNVEGRIFHLWHPSANYETNPNGKANGDLLNRYKRASGNKTAMLKLIKERNSNLKNDRDNKINLLKSEENRKAETPKSKICFAILVHEDRELVKQLIDNVRYYCPNSAIVLYNGGDDPLLCKDLGVPVCPSSRKLERGWTTIYFLDVMEWLEELGLEYEYFINIDSDALFIKKGYEEFIQTEMEDTDYMAVLLRIPEDDWYIGNELKKDIDRWKKFFNVKPFYGVFNVGQVISRPVVKSLIDPEISQRLKKALVKTVSFGMDEVVFVNMAKELGFRLKKYPNALDSKMIRYRPYASVEEVISWLNNKEGGGLVHPVIRERDEPVRNLILNINGEINKKQYHSKEFPWYKKNPDEYSVSLPIKSTFGNLELIVQSDSTLTHYWQQPKGKWYKGETFAKGVTGNPLFFQSKTGQFGVVCKMENGQMGFWLRDNKEDGFPWYGPTIQDLGNAEPILVRNLDDDKHIMVFREDDHYFYGLINNKEME